MGGQTVPNRPKIVDSWIITEYSLQFYPPSGTRLRVCSSIFHGEVFNLGSDRIIQMSSGILTEPPTDAIPLASRGDRQLPLAAAVIWLCSSRFLSVKATRSQFVFANTPRVVSSLEYHNLESTMSAGSTDAGTARSSQIPQFLNKLIA
jgi:hypothetical protein